jgi:hypothetical protein
VFFYECQVLEEGASSRDPACCLGMFSLVSVKTSGRMKSSNAITALVTLETCILDDKRPESVEGVTRYGEQHISLIKKLL